MADSKVEKKEKEQKINNFEDEPDKPDVVIIKKKGKKYDFFNDDFYKQSSLFEPEGTRKLSFPIFKSFKPLSSLYNLRNNYWNNIPKQETKPETKPAQVPEILHQENEPEESEDEEDEDEEEEVIEDEDKNNINKLVGIIADNIDK